MRESLEELIKRIVENLDVEKLDKRIINYQDYKNKYVNLKPSVIVKIDLTDGRTCNIDVMDYFEGVVR